MGGKITQKEIAEKTGIYRYDVSVALCQTRVVSCRAKREYDADEAKAAVLAYCEKRLVHYEAEAAKWRKRKLKAEKL